MICDFFVIKIFILFPNKRTQDSKRIVPLEGAILGCLAKQKFTF